MFSLTEKFKYNVIDPKNKKIVTSACYGIYFGSELEDLRLDFYNEDFSCKKIG